MSDEIVTLEDDDQVLDVELENYNVPVQEDVIHAGTTAYWDAQSSLVAEAGHIYAYTDYANIEGNDSPGIKVGDGVTFLSELPFVSGDTTVLDAHIADTVIHVTAAEKESWNNKVDPEEGKGLSENDFTDALKAKLEGIEAGAEVNVQPDWNQSVTTADDFIKNKPSIPEKTSDLVNDSGFITANEAPLQGVKGSAESSYRTGNVSVSKADIGLGNVDNTSDANKPISTAVQAALDTKQGTLTAGENITIDANNVISASGGGTGAVDSVNGKTGVVVLDADDVGALPDTTTASDLGAYVKPVSGIPKTDLASGVQTSLNKADTALQTAPVTSVNSKTGAVTLNAADVGAYEKPSGGIPKNDLSSAVQTSLDKADTALQTAPVTSVNSKTGAVSLNASDVNALPDSTTFVSTVNGQSGDVIVNVPTKTSDLTNDSGFLTSAVTTFNGQSGAVTYTAPVTSVDGKTGAVTVMPSGGTTGQVLTKTASGEEWQNPTGGGTWGSITGTISDQTDLQDELDDKADLTYVETLTGSVATIEESPATAIHAEGSYIVWNGQLYEVTASIAVGETLTVGTNITAKTVGGELTTLKNGLTNVETGINELHTSGYVPVMTTFSQSGTAVDYTIPSTGLYAVRASTGSTAGTLSVYMFNNAGNPITTVINVNAPAWATIFTPPIPLIAGTIIKAQFNGPNGSGGAIVKYAV